MFSGDKERDQWYEMGYYILLLHDQVIRVNFFYWEHLPLTSLSRVQEFDETRIKNYEIHSNVDIDFLF